MDYALAHMTVNDAHFTMNMAHLTMDNSHATMHNAHLIMHNSHLIMLGLPPESINRLLLGLPTISRFTDYFQDSVIFKMG